MKYLQIRKDWLEAKETASKTNIESLAEYKRLVQEGLKISATNFFYVLQQMKKINLTGVPYLDARTFKGWKDIGYKVKKGEKSKIHGVSWLKVEGEVEGENKDMKKLDKVIFPKVYHLFHISQIEKDGELNLIELKS